MLRLFVLALALLGLTLPADAWIAQKAGSVSTAGQLLLGGTATASNSTTDTYIPVGYMLTQTTTEGLWGIMPVPGSITSIKLHSTVAPGSGKSYTLTLMQNGTASSTSCQLANTATSASCTVSGALSAGDRISWWIHPVGTPSSGRITVSALFVPTTANDSVLFAQGPGLSSTATWGVNPFNNASSTPNFRTNNIFPDGGTLDKYYIQANAPGGTASYTYTIDINGAAAAGSPSATMTGTATTASDTTASGVAVAAGNSVQFASTPSGTPASATAAFGARYRPTTTGSYVYMISQGGDNTISANYFPMSGGNAAAQSTEASAQTITHAATYTRLYVKASAAPGASGSGIKRTFTLNVNGVPSAMTCDIIETATTCTDTAHTVVVADDALVDTSDTPVGGTAASNVASISYLVHR